MTTQKRVFGMILVIMCNESENISTTGAGTGACAGADEDDGRTK